MKDCAPPAVACGFIEDTRAFSAATSSIKKRALGYLAVPSLADLVRLLGDLPAVHIGALMTAEMRSEEALWLMKVFAAIQVGAVLKGQFQ
jgi:hypothetical protein